MASNLQSHVRIGEIAKLQQLKARAVLAQARHDEDKAHAALSLASNERQQGLGFWQERLASPNLDPILIGQLKYVLAQNEAAYEEAEASASRAAARSDERRAQLAEAQARSAALSRVLARSIRNWRRKREENTADDYPARRGPQS